VYFKTKQFATTVWPVVY